MCCLAAVDLIKLHIQLCLCDVLDSTFPMNPVCCLNLKFSLVKITFFMGCPDLNCSQQVDTQTTHVCKYKEIHISRLCVVNVVRKVFSQGHSPNEAHL